MRTLAGLFVALAFVAPAVALAADSGVVGQVVAQQEGGLGCVRAPCFKPVAGVTVTFTRGTHVLRATSDRRGRFRLLLAPGMWTVRAPGLVTLAGRPRVVRVPDSRVVPISLVVARPQRQFVRKDP